MDWIYKCRFCVVAVLAGGIYLVGLRESFEFQRELTAKARHGLALQYSFQPPIVRTKTGVGLFIDPHSMKAW